MAKISGEVKVVYSAEDRATTVGKQVQGGLRQTDKVSSSVSEKMKRSWLSTANIIRAAIVGLIIRSLKNMAIETMQAGLEIYKFSKTTGLAVEEVQKLQYAAKQQGLEFESLAKLFPFLSKSIVDGTKDQIAAFKRMGIEVLDVNKKQKSAYVVMLEIADWMKTSGVDAERKMTIARKLLGKSAAEAIPFLKQGREEIERWGKEYEKTGAMLSGDEVLGMKVIAENINAIKTSLTGFGRKIITEMSPMLNALTKWLKDNAPALADIGASIGKELSDLLSWSLTSFFPFFIHAWNLSKLAVEGVLWGILKLREAQMKLQEFTSLGIVKLLPWWQKEKDFIAFNLEQLEKQMNATLDADEKLTEMQRSLKLYFSDAGRLLQEAIDKIKEMDAVMPPDEEDIVNQEKWLKLLDKEQKAYEKILALNKELKTIRREFYQDTWRLVMESANLMGDELGKFGGLALTGMKGMWDISLGYDPYAQQMEQLREFYQKRIDAIVEQYRIERELLIEQNATEFWLKMAQEDMLQKKREEYRDLDFQNAKLREAQKLQIYQNNINMVMGLLGVLASFTDENSKILFAIERAAAVASILVSTHKAAAQALAVPPAPNFPLAKATMIAGYAMAAATAAMAIKQFTQKTASIGGGVAGGGGYRYEEPQTPQWQEEEKKISRTINVYVYGNILDHDKFARELIPSLDKAWGDGAS